MKSRLLEAFEGIDDIRKALPQIQSTLLKLGITKEDMLTRGESISKQLKEGSISIEDISKSDSACLIMYRQPKDTTPKPKPKSKPKQEIEDSIPTSFSARQPKQTNTRDTLFENCRAVIEQQYNVVLMGYNSLERTIGVVDFLYKLANSQIYQKYIDLPLAELTKYRRMIQPKEKERRANANVRLDKTTQSYLSCAEYEVRYNQYKPYRDYIDSLNNNERKALQMLYKDLKSKGYFTK